MYEVSAWHFLEWCLIASVVWVLELLYTTKNNLILLFKQFKQFLLNWITNISLLTFLPFIANIGRKEGWFPSQRSTFTCWPSLFCLFCFDWGSLCWTRDLMALPPPSSIYQDNCHPSSPGFTRRCLKINCGIFQWPQLQINIATLLNIQLPGEEIRKAGFGEATLWPVLYSLDQK